MSDDSMPGPGKGNIEPLPHGLLGGSTNMKFTLDDDGYAKVQKSFNTGGWNVNVTGTVTDPDGKTWNVEVKTSAGTDKTKNDVPTGQGEDFTLKTNMGSTTVTLKIWSTAGAADAGVSGHVNIKY